MDSYAKLKEIGRGAYGVAFLAKDKANNKEVVIKVNATNECLLLLLQYSLSVRTLNFVNQQLVYDMHLL